LTNVIDISIGVFLFLGTWMTVFLVGQLSMVAGRSFGMIQATTVGQFEASRGQIWGSK